MADSRFASVMGTTAPAVLAGGRPRRTAAWGALLGTVLPVMVLSHGFVLEKVLDLSLEMRLAAVWGTSGRRDMYLLASSVLVPAGLMELAGIPLFVDFPRRGAGAG